MDIIRARQEKRMNQINTISNSIKQARDNGRNLDEEKLALTTALELGLSVRTAKEYIKLALHKLEYET